MLKTSDAGITRAVNQTSAAAETDATKAVIHTEVKRSLVLHPRLRYEARKESDAKIAVSLFDEQGLQNSGLKISWQTRKSYPQQPPLRVELSASGRGYKRCSRRRFLILKSLDSDNLLERLKQDSSGSSSSMEASPRYKSLNRKCRIAQSIRSQRKTV